MLKKERGKEEEEKIINYQMMKSKNYQNENKEGSLNEKVKKEKEKYDILQIEKHDKKEKEKKVTTKENYTESNLEKKYVVLEAEKMK